MIMTKYIDTPLNERFAAKVEIADLQGNSPYLSNLRKKAFEYFLTHGFPSIKNEEWRFTNMLLFLKEEYNLDDENHSYTEAEKTEFRTRVEAHLRNMGYAEEGLNNVYRIVMVNGSYQKELSVLPQNDQIEVMNLLDAEDTAVFEKYFGKIASEDHYPQLNSFNFGKVAKVDGFWALNTALFRNGLMISVPANKVIEQPIHLINIFTVKDNAWMHGRNLFVVGKNAELNLIESVLRDDNDYKIFVNGVTEIALEHQAQLHHYDVQSGQENMRYVQRVEATQVKHSNYSNYTFTFPGADIVRNTLNLHLDEDETESHLYGLYFTAGNQIVDNHTAVHHKKERCVSNQLYKGVMADKSKAVFNGKIFVYEDAQLTNAFQQSNNILLSDTATIDAKPQLEIWADDVKASHGTTVGQLDEESIFYLQSRGIKTEEAKNIMINAFAFDVTQKVKDQTLRSYLEKMIEGKMQELH